MSRRPWMAESDLAATAMLRRSRAGGRSYRLLDRGPTLGRSIAGGAFSSGVWSEAKQDAQASEIRCERGKGRRARLSDCEKCYA